MLSQIRCRCAVASPRLAAGREPPPGRQVERDRHHVVVTGRVVAEVGGPPVGVGAVPAPAEQQALDQVVADAPGGRGHDALPAQDDPADGGRVLGDQQAHVLAEDVLGGVDRDQVRRDLVPDQDGRDDDGGHAADLRQPEGALAEPRRPEHLAEPRVDHVLPHVRGGLLRGHARRRRGQHVHQLGDHRDGRGRPVGDEPDHPGQVRVLQREPGQVPVHGDELAQRGVLAVQVPGAWPPGSLDRRGPLARARPAASTGDQFGTAMTGSYDDVPFRSLWQTTRRSPAGLSTWRNR